MKKRISVILFVILLLVCLFPFSAPAANAAGAAIRLELEPDAGETEQAAAAVLQDCLEKITGTCPPLTDTDAAGQTIALRIADGQARKKGSYTLRGDGDAFTIEAADERGLWNGVYGFLRRVCGVEVYAPDAIRVPEDGGFTLPVSYDYDYELLLEYADMDWASGNDLTFAVANGLNGSRSGLDRPYGKPVNYLGFCHTLGAGLVPYWEYFDAHPEYYALTERSGRREPTQVCLSNPDVLRLTIEAVRNTLNEGYDPEAALNIVSVSQLDNMDYCVCDGCAALADIAALCGVCASTWLVDFQQLGLVTEAGVLLALIAGAIIPLTVYGYSRKKGMTAKKGVAGVVALGVLAGAFAAVLMVLDRNMLNGLDSHLAYFTVCLVLEGVALLGLLLLLPCAFLKRIKDDRAERNTNQNRFASEPEKISDADR